MKVFPITGSRVVVGLLLLVSIGSANDLAEPVSPDSLSGRVYNSNPTPSRTPSVPFVDTDTTTYPKKFWMGHKQQLSHPVRSIYPRITAQDSILCVTYSSREAVTKAGTWWVYRVLSFDYGLTWSEPRAIENTGDFNAGDLFPLIEGDTILLSFSRQVEGIETTYQQVVAKESLKDAALTTPVVLQQSTANLHHSQLVRHQDTTWLFYVFSDWDYNHLASCRSTDNGQTWDTLNFSGPSIGWPMSFQRANDHISWVGEEGVESYCRLLNPDGVTWTDRVLISETPANTASQWPNACSNGLSDLHAGWFDFDGAEGGWYGYIFYTHSYDGGESWGPIWSLSPTDDCEHSAFWADSQRVYAVWNDCRENGSPDFALYLRYSHDRGMSWSPEIEVVDKIDPAREPDLYGQGDLVYLVWNEQHPPDWIWGIYFQVGGWYIPGDVNRSEDLTVSDLTFLVSYLFRGRAAPVLLGAAEMNGSAPINIADLTYFVDYLFRGGAEPVGAQ